MTSAIVFSFAVEEGLRPIPGAVPYGVLSRQIPRLLVNRLNGSSDRGVRFFPFVGNDSGERRFLRLTGLLSLDRLCSLLEETPVPPLLVDGQIGLDCLHLRLQDTRTGRPIFDQSLAFEPGDPQPFLRRALFEITGALGWKGEMPSLPDLQGEALASYLCAHDELLSLEVNLLRSEGVEPLASARKAMVEAPDDPDVRQVFLETSVAMVRQGVTPDAVARTVLDVVALDQSRDASFLFMAAAVLEACDHLEEACALYTRSAELDPGHCDATIKSAHLHFARGRFVEAREVLRAYLNDGPRELTLLAQLAAVEERLGNLTARDKLFDELLQVGDLEPKVARMVAVHLLGEHRYTEAQRVAERALADHPRQPALHLERARAILLQGGADLAQDALAACLALDPTRSIRTEANRLLAFASRPGLLGEIQQIQRHLQEGQPGRALVCCRRVVRRHRGLADAWLLLGTVHQRLNNLRRATYALRRVVSLEPRQGEAHNRLGILLVSRGQYQQGYGHLIRAAGELPEDPGPRIHLAQACHFLSRPEEGRSFLDEAERLGGDPSLIATVRQRFYG